MPHAVIEVRFRYLGGWVVFTGTDPDRRITRAVVGRGLKFRSSRWRGFDKDIISFGNTNQEPPVLDWDYVLAVGSYDGHRLASEFNVKIGGRGAINNAESNCFIGSDRQG